MADCYTNFSLIMALPDVAARTYALELHGRMEEHRDDEDRPDDIPESLWEQREDWCLEFDPSGETSLWLHSSSGGIDAVCAFIQHLLRQHGLMEAVGFEWSHDCSKPCTDAYGGGAAFITAQNIRTYTTGEWLSRQTQRHRRLNLR
jgi:hypothetical protein